MNLYSSSNTVGVHYKIGKKIGEGSFGIIFEGTSLVDKLPIAIKFEPRKCDAPQLRDEYRLYRVLSHCHGIPRTYYFGLEGVHNILVLDLLGPSLEDLFDWCSRRFSAKTVIQVAKQMIERVELIHTNNLIYRDIKPDNFLIGRPDTPESNTIFVVDFGMAKQYRDPRTRHHIPYRENKALSGTARYMLINTHVGREQLRRDDMESLGHVFMYFLRGSLPWQGMRASTNKRKYEKIGSRKQLTNINELCRGYPIQFAQYLVYVRNLGFDECPDYQYLYRLMDLAMKDVGGQFDNHYDWMDLNGGHGWNTNLNKKVNLHGYGQPNMPLSEPAQNILANSMRMSHTKKPNVSRVLNKTTPDPQPLINSHRTKTKPIDNAHTPLLSMSKDSLNDICYYQSLSTSQNSLMAHTSDGNSISIGLNPRNLAPTTAGRPAGNVRFDYRRINDVFGSDESPQQTGCCSAWSRVFCCG